MKVFLLKLKKYASYWGARFELDSVRIRSRQKKGEDILKTGNWLGRRIQLNKELRNAFPECISHTNLKAWKVRPVDTWQREQEIESLLDKFHFTFESILIIRNPYRLSPMSALLLFETKETCYVRYTVRGKTPACDFTHTTESCVTKHRVPVFGLYASYENQVELELLNENREVTAKKKIVIPVGKVSEKIETMVESIRKNEDTAVPFVLVTGGYKSSTYAFDCQGEIRYLLSRTPRQYGVYPMPDERFLFTDRNINRPTYNNPHAIVLYDMDYLGRVKETYYVKEGVHHWATAVPGTEGRMVLGATSSLEQQLMEGTMLQFDRDSGTVVGMWNLGDYFPKKFQKKRQDWAHLNRIYCVDERYVIFSLRNVSTVVKFDMKEKAIVWLMTHPDVYEGTELEDKVLHPVGEDFHYFLQQHAVEVVDTGLTDEKKGIIELTLFDNHCNTKRKVKWFDGKTDSYACFYRIDEKNFTVETTKVIPCAMSPTRSSVYYEKEKRRVFGMAGAACSTEEGDKALIYEWDFDTAEEVNRYETSGGFFKAYPFEIKGSGLEQALPISREYRKGHLEQPVPCGALPSGAKSLSHEMRKEMDLCYMDDLICIRAKDHKIEKIYFQGVETTWERDFTDTVQKTEVFASKIYYIAATTENLPTGKYDLLIRYDGQVYDTGRHFTKNSL